VVLKRLHRHCAADPDLVDMFRHEARILAALDHPGILRLVELAPDRGSWMQVLERVDGLDLLGLMTRAKELPLALGVEVVRQLLGALGHAHTRAYANGPPLQVVHRDIAPGNVMVARDGTIKLLDFGIATSLWRPDPDRGRMKGTRGYLSPEAITGEHEVDARSDLFAVGVLLYELTTHRRLFQGSPVVVMAAIAEGPTPSPARAVPGYPPALDLVVRRALARVPTLRFESAAAMSHALEDAAAVLGLPPARAELGGYVSRLLDPSSPSVRSTPPT
jgi:serine/threonine protein kinase